MEEGQAKLVPKEIREGLLEEVTFELSLEGYLSFKRQGMGEGHSRNGDRRAKAVSISPAPSLPGVQPIPTFKK